MWCKCIAYRMYCISIHTQNTRLRASETILLFVGIVIFGCRRKCVRQNGSVDNTKRTIVHEYVLQFTFFRFLAVTRNIFGMWRWSETTYRLHTSAAQHTYAARWCDNVSQPAIERQRYDVKLSERPKLFFRSRQICITLSMRRWRRRREWRSQRA